MRSLCLALIVALVVSACATSPTGRSQFLLISPEAAIAQSTPAYFSTIEDLGREGKLLRDPVLADRIEIITGRLVSQAERYYPRTADWEWSVALIDEPDVVNAWCMAGGRMAIYSGAVYKLNLSDDEIAHIMGHEISHAVANHTAEQMSIAVAQGLAITTIAVASESQDIANLAGLAANVALTLPNSRSAELEADELGMQLATLAGYDPNAAVTLWEKMGNQGGAKPPEFLSTHPSPENRSERLAALALQVGGLAPAAPPRPHRVRIYP